MSVVVLLHLAGLGAVAGFPLPWEARIVLLVAYLLGLRQAFDPSSVTAVAAGRAVERGRAGTAAACFAAGFGTMAAGVVFLLVTALRMLRPDGSAMWLYLGVIAALQVVVVVLTIRRRRSAAPVRLDRVIAQVRKPVQLFPVGALSAVSLIAVAETVLVVLAAGPLAAARPLYLMLTLPVLFAAGVSVTAFRVSPARAAALHVAATVAVALAAAAPTLLALNLRPGFPALPDLPDTLTGDTTDVIDYAQSQPAALADYLLSRPLLLLLLLVVILAVVTVRRARANRNTSPATTSPTAPASRQAAASRPQPSGPSKPSLLERARQGLRTRRSARPADQQPVAQPIAPLVQSAELPARPVPYGGVRAVARATVHDSAYRNQPVSGAPGNSGSGIAIVTGAGAGLGRSIALALADAGYGILAVDLDANNAAICANDARTYGVPAQAVRADLSDPRYLDRIIAVAEEWGRTEVLVTAGAGGWPAPNPGETAEMRLTVLAAEAMRTRAGAVLNTVPASSADRPALTRFTAEQTGVRDGVRTMLLITDELAPAAATAAALDLIRTGAAGTVLDLTAPVADRRPPRFARGVASVA
ncbi:SDR family NAD(P)-dependent oxidoreductase [Actinoplanes sp. NPDC026670]|uniref:SDR family NAD(P)-dependent oxidoreductase n=1 Tax=Actinoplanes sp. NPDC026670 TaxID=3154700 RepID=UPI003406066C